VPGTLPGDYNNNGIVDAADYTVWRDNVGSTASLANDSFSGTIGQARHDQWIANFGWTAGSSSIDNAVVPEPSPLLFATIASCIGVTLAVRKR
jgi:hypothetical protein